MKEILTSTTSLIWQSGDSKYRITECHNCIKEGVLDLKKKVGLAKMCRNIIEGVICINEVRLVGVYN